MRRITREVLSVKNIAEILEKTNVCRLGLCDGDKPYVLPIHFAFELIEGKFVIYCHAAIAGRKLDIIRINPNVCFEADMPGKIIAGQSACDYTSYYESVIGSGKAEIVACEDQKIKALGLIMARFGFEGEPRFSEGALKATAIIRLELEEVSAKRHDENQ